MTLVDVQHRLTPIGVFFDAPPIGKLISVALLAATAGAVVLAFSSRRGQSGAAFLAALRFAGPLLGLLGAAYAGLYQAVGRANVLDDVPAQSLAHGVAEAMLQIVLGMFCGVVAVVAAWAAESRGQGRPG